MQLDFRAVLQMILIYSFISEIYQSPHEEFQWAVGLLIYE